MIEKGPDSLKFSEENLRLPNLNALLLRSMS